VLYEEATRVPFIVSRPGVTKAGAVDREHLISNGLDLIPTLCDFAGVPKPASLHGLSARRLAEGGDVRDWRDCVVVENHLGRLVHQGRWKYLVGREAKHGDNCGICPGRITNWEGRVREMLIDLETDPAAFIALRKIEVSAVPGHAKPRQFPGRARQFLHERALDAKVMRQVKFAPPAGIEIRLHEGDLLTGSRGIAGWPFVPKSSHEAVR
jgi:hypothetical protein